MTRSAVWCLLCIVALGLLGCASGKPVSAEEQQQRQVRKWEEAKAGNQRRLAGEAGVEKNIFVRLWEMPGEVVRRIFSPAPAVSARKLLEDDPDLRREGIFELVNREFGRGELYQELYRKMAVDDPDYLVRVAAIRALNRCRDTQSIDVFLKGLQDPKEPVRLEAAKALANVPDAKAVPALIRYLRDPGEDRDVRLAAADALRNFPTVEGAQALIRVLQDRDFGVSWQARQSLRLMTGQDYRYDERQWLAYLTSESRPLG